MIQKKLKKQIKLGILVEIITGNHKKSSGKIVGYTKDKQKVFIENINLHIRHNKFVDQAASEKTGRMITRVKRTLVPGPIDISNIKIINNDVK